MGHVGVHQRGQVVEVYFDSERIFADKQLLHGFDARACHRSGGAGFAVSGEAAVGVDANQAIAGDVLDRHGADVRNLDLVQIGRGDGLQTAE